MRRNPVMLATLAVAVALLGACGEDDAPSVRVPTNDSSTTAATETSTTSTTEVPASTEDVSGPSEGRGYLTDVRAAHHDGFDRVTFTFSDALPGWKVGYTKRPVTEDGSGRRIAVEGDNVLSMRFEPAGAARAEGEKAVMTYEGSRRIRPGDTTVVVELVQAGDFEAVLNWVAGVRGKPGFRVSTLAHPDRVVVDVVSS